MTVEQVERLKEFVKPAYWKTLEPVIKDEDERRQDDHEHRRSLQGILDIEPREHGKTTRIQALVLWFALYKKAWDIMIIGASLEMAKSSLTTIREELEENTYIIEDFGKTWGDKKWSDEGLMSANGVLIEAKGRDRKFRGAKRGAHRPDLIIIDDLLTEQDAYSATIRGKIYTKLKRTVFNLGQAARYIVINTIFHHDDPVLRLFAEIESKHSINHVWRLLQVTANMYIFFQKDISAVSCMLHERFVVTHTYKEFIFN